ncbi:MAG: hypothetical protein CL908_18270 [Deltaproteobacteria bacterium]|nr:hypothetical protein [Deltaproteobacteria bacterium]
MGAGSAGQETSSGGAPIQEALQGDLRADASLLPEKFRTYFLNYLERDMGRCQTTLSFLPPVSDAAPISVLEVGSFPGVMSVVIKQSGYDIHCLDLDPGRMSDLAHKYGLDLERCDIETEDIPFSDDSYDVVVFTEILEHLRIDPLHALRELKRVLKPGGTLILTVPNISPIHRLRFLFGADYQGDIVDEFEKLDRLGHMGHIRVYSALEVQRMLEYAGFEVRKVTPAGRLNLPSAGIRLALKAISLAAAAHPKATFPTDRNAFYSHLYVTAEA